MLSDQLRNVSLSTELGLLGESMRVFNEHFPLRCTSEVIEFVLIKQCELWTLAAVDELLLLLPSDWTNVPELAQ